MLGTYQGMEFERLLRAIGDYMNADYCVPVYHVEKESDKYGTVAETIKSSSNLDIIEGTTVTFIDHDKETTATFPRRYIQHFAKENDIDDNIPVVVDKQFIQTVALSRIQQSLSLLQQDIESNKSNTK